jgi:lipopolysaccharide export LptBFGC system permease protein LptF
MFLPIGGMAFLSVGFGRKSRKKKLLGFVLVCMVLSGLVFLASCSGGGSQGSSGNAGTPAGSYTITVTGTATGFTQGGNPPQLALTVQ